MNELNDQRSSPRGNSNGFLGYAIHLVGGGITIGLFLVLVWSISASHTRSLIEAERYSAQYADDTDELIKKRCSTTDPVAMASCAADVVRGQHEAQRDEWDLYAQKQMAEWAFWMLIVTLASTVATVIGIWFVRENLIAVREANAGAREIIKLAREEQRAWVTFRLDTATLEGRVDTEIGLKISVRFTYTLDNLGNQPSVDTCVFCSIFRSDGFFEDDAPDQLIAEALKKYPAFSRQTIYPRQPKPINQFIGVTLKDMPTSALFKDRDFLSCVVLYRTAGDQTIRHLANVYEIGENVRPDNGTFLRYPAAERIF